jgi:Fe-S cluster assembly protein SufD
MSILVSPSPIPNSDVVHLTSSLLDRDAYLTGLLNLVKRRHMPSLQNDDMAWLKEVRSSAANWVRHSTLPTTRDEEWRFTDLSSLRQIQFHHVETLHATSPHPYTTSLQKDIASLTLPEAANNRLVFVNGVYAPELSTVSLLPDGVVVSNLAGFSEPSRLQRYFAQAEGALEVFTALNTAGMSDAAVVWVSKNVVVQSPIHLVFVSFGDEPTVFLPRCLVVAESGSSVSLVEEYINRQNVETLHATSLEHLTNAVTEIWVDENAEVSHSRIEWDGTQGFHVGKTAVSQARYSRYSCNAISFGGKLSRHNLEVLQTGEQTETTLNGLTMVGGTQLADTHSAIALNYPYGMCQQVHKFIVGERAHGVFNGKVFVPQPAQMTNASQLNRNLLLSPKARVDTKPQLEITADNVKCAHGATVSQLEDDEIFYLQSRGIDTSAARSLLINAFAAAIISQVRVPSLQERLTQAVNNRYESL